MAKKCFMCGRDVTEGILCEKCDKPRKKTQGVVQASSLPAAASPSKGAPDARTTPMSQAATAPAIEHDPFPKAPIINFPVESASPAITSVVNLLVASGVACVLLGPDRAVKFVSDESRRIFDTPHSELANLAAVESKAGIRVTDLSVPTTAGVRIGSRNFIYSLVPMSGGASGAVLVFRHADPMNEAHASFVTYVRETVLGPLRAIRESLRAAGRSRGDHFLDDTAAGIDQVLSSLELAPEVEEAAFSARPVPTVTEVVRRVAERFRAYADLKGIVLQVDVQELVERFSDHDQLADALAILMENALHYVPG